MLKRISMKPEIELNMDHGENFFIKGRYNVVITVSALAIVLYVGLNLLVGPVGIANGLITLAYFMMAGPICGISQDIISTNRNIEYFLFGHRKEQKTLVWSNYPFVQACAWGMTVTFPKTLIISITAFFLAWFIPISPLVLPAMMISIPLIILPLNEIIAALTFKGNDSLPMSDDPSIQN